MTDSILDNAEYAQTWDTFIGQTAAKRQLQTAAGSAAMRGVQLPHILLASGEHGIGKTTLSLLAAKEMKTEVKVVSGAISANEARMILSEMEDRDILFWDEFHLAVMGGKGKAEWLLNFLQDGVIVGPLGEEPQPKVTIIAATTEVGKLPETIVSRFQLRPTLEGYNENEATAIAGTMCAKVFANMVYPDPSVLRQVAVAANHNPRAMKMVLNTLRDITVFENRDVEGGMYDIDDALDMLGLTIDGLDRTARRYLTTLLDFPEGCGLASIVEILQEPGGVAPTERILMNKGFIAKKRAGRILTQQGIKRARALKKEELVTA